MPTPEPILAGLSGAGLAGQPTAPNSPQVLFSPSRRKVFVNGFEFDQDDADSALQSREHIKAPPQAPKDGDDWQPVSPDAYANYYNAIKDPSLGARFKGSFRGAVGGLQEIAGGALQFAGSTGDGSAGVRLSEAGQERARKNAPYVAQATDIGDPGVGVADFVASTLGMLAPSVLESITAGIVGAGVGTAVGGPAGTVGGLAAGFAGKSVIKKSLLEAAKAQTKKTATKAQQKELADFAGGQVGQDVLSAIRSQARRQAAAGGAIAGTQVNNTAIGIGDVYSEGLEQGTEHRGIALGAGIAYGALETATEALLAGRVVSLLGNPKALTKARLGTRVGLTGLAGAGVEGATELGQESIVVGATGQVGDDGVGERLVNAFAAGAVGGGVLGGATGTLGLSRAGQQLKDGEPTDLVQNAQQFGGATVTEETTVQKPIVENIPTGVPKSSTVGGQTTPVPKGEGAVEQSPIVDDTEFKTSAFPTQAQIEAAEEFADAEAAFNPLPNAPGVQPTPPPTQPPEQLTLPEQPVAYGAGVARPEASPDNVNNPIIQDLDNEINKKIRRNNARVDIHLARNNPEDSFARIKEEANRKIAERLGITYEEYIGQKEGRKPADEPNNDPRAVAARERNPGYLYELQTLIDETGDTYSNDAKIVALFRDGSGQLQREIEDYTGLTRRQLYDGVLPDRGVARPPEQPSTPREYSQQLMDGAEQELADKFGTPTTQGGQDAIPERSAESIPKKTQTGRVPNPNGGTGISGIGNPQSGTPAPTGTGTPAPPQETASGQTNPRGEPTGQAVATQATNTPVVGQRDPDVFHPRIVTGGKRETTPAELWSWIRPFIPGATDAHTSKLSDKSMGTIYANSHAFRADMQTQFSGAAAAINNPDNADVQFSRTMMLDTFFGMFLKHWDKVAGVQTQRTVKGLAEPYMKQVPHIDTYQRFNMLSDMVTRFPNDVFSYDDRVGKGVLIANITKSLHELTKGVAAGVTESNTSYTMKRANGKSIQEMAKELVSGIQNKRLAHAIQDPYFGFPASRFKDGVYPSAPTNTWADSPVFKGAGKTALPAPDTTTGQVVEVLNNSWESQAVMQEEFEYVIPNSLKGVDWNFELHGHPLSHYFEPGSFGDAQGNELPPTVRARQTRDGQWIAHAVDPADNTIRAIASEIGGVTADTPIVPKDGQPTLFKEIGTDRDITQSLPRADVVGVVQSTLGKFRKVVQKEMNVRVFANAAEMKATAPTLYQDGINGMKDGEFEARVPNAMAFTSGVNISMFSDNIATKKQAEFVLGHEALVHFGFRAMFSEAQLNTILNKVYDTNSGIRVLVDRQVAAGEDKIIAIEEALADQAAVIDASVIARLWNSIKDVLNKFGLAFDDDYSRVIISRARAGLREGGTGIVSLQQLTENINAMKRKAGDGRFKEVSDQDTLAHAQVTHAVSLAVQTTQSKSWDVINEASKLPGRGASLWNKASDTVAKYLSTMTQGASQNDGMRLLLHIMGLIEGSVKEFQQRHNKRMEPMTNVNWFPGGKNLTQKSRDKVNSLAAIATLSNGIISDDAIQKYRDVIYSDHSDGSARMRVDREAWDIMRKDAHISFETITGKGLPITNIVETDDGPVERTSYIAFKDLTQKEYEVYTVLRDTMDEAQWDLAVATADAFNREKEESVDKLDKQLGGLTDAQRGAVVVLESFVGGEARDGAEYVNGKWTYRPESETNAQLLREVIHRALHVPEAREALRKKVRGEEFEINPQFERDTWLANYQNPRLNELVDAIETFNLIDGPTVVNGRTVEQRAYDITRTFENIFTAEVDMSSLQRSIKRTVASGHFPLPRSGTFHTVTRAYIYGTNEPYKLYDDYRTNAPYFIEDNEVHARDRQQELDEVYAPDGKRVKYRIPEQGNKPDVFIELRAEYSKSPQVSGLSGHVSLKEFSKTLELLGINLDLGERRRLNKALAGLDSSVVKNMKREQTPGFDRDIFGKGILPQLNTMSHVIGMITHGHRLDDVILDNELWEGSHQKVLDAHAKMKAVEAAGNPAKIEIAQREYDQIAWRRYNSANVKSAKTLMYKGYGANRKSVLRENLGKSEDYRDAGKQVVNFLKQNGGNVDGVEDYFTRGFAGKMKMLVVVGQLGMNPALALHNMSAVITHAGPFLASYSAKRGFGGGFGIPKATRAILEATLLMKNKNWADPTHIQGVLDGKIPNKHNIARHVLEALLEATKTGILLPQQASAIAGSAAGITHNARVAAAIDGWMTPFTYSEQFTRRSTFVAAYTLEHNRQTVSLGDSKAAQDTAHKAAVDFAIDATNQSQGNYSTYNRSMLARGSITQHLMVYKMFQITTTQLMLNLSRGGTIGMLAIIFIVAGAKGAPFAEDMMDLLDSLVQKLGIRMGSVEAAAARMFDDIIPGSSKWAMHGVLDNITGGAHSSGLGLGNMLPLTRVLTEDNREYEELKDFLGPVYHGVLALAGTAGDVARFAGEKVGIFDDHTSLKSIARNSPVAAFKALGDATTFYEAGAITNKKGQIVAPNVTGLEITLRALGLYPARASKAYDVVRLGKQDIAYARSIKADFTQSWVKAKLLGDTKRAQAIERRVREWNRAASGTQFEMRNFIGSGVKALRSAQQSQFERFYSSVGHVFKPSVDELNNILDPH